MKKYLSALFANFPNIFWYHYILWTLVFTSLFTISFMLLFYLDHGEFFYVDTDCYTRALRITDWLQNFQWKEKIFPFTNHPYGFVLHFTRISDIIWLIFTLPFIPFMALKEAVFYGGFFFSPFFLYLTLVSVLWGIKPYLKKTKNREIIFLSIFIFSILFCCKLSHAFDFYRPDHHGLMCFVFSYNISVILRSYIIKHNFSELFIAGVFTGCGLWASSAPEGLYIAGSALLILTTDVIFFKQNTKNPLYYALGFFYANLAAWLINPPFGGYTIPDNARLSVVHVVIAAFILVSFAVWHFANFKGKFKQIFSISGFALISALLLIILFGTETLFAPVYAEEVSKYFIPRINEMNSIIRDNKFLLPPVLAGLLIISCFSVKNSPERCLFIMYLITAPLGVLIARFYAYYLCIWLVLYAFGLTILIKQKNENKDNKYKIAAFIYLIWPIFYLASFDFQPDIIPADKLNGVVLTDIFRGPELVWKQNIDTVASPYHTNIEGIRDNHVMWFTSDENELKRLLKKRDVNYITLPQSAELCYYNDPENNTDKLYGKVLTGKDIYPWMEKTGKRTYRINYDKF